MLTKSQIKTYDIGLVPHYDELEERFIFPFPQLNYLLNGGLMDRVTMITSSTDNGKTTLASQIIMSIISQGYNCCCFFGEDTARESQDRIFKQDCKDDPDATYYKAYKDTNCGEFLLTDKAYQKCVNKFGGHLFLYNTMAQADVDTILDAFEEQRVRNNCRVFLLDNVEQFEFSSDNENKAIKDIVVKIRDYAINQKVHIFLIAHIRKTERGVIMPDLNDVKGTSAMVNIAKNVLVLVRTDKMDKNSPEYKTLSRVMEENGYDIEKAQAIIRVAKTKGRKLGYVGLTFDSTTQTYTELKRRRERPKLEEIKDDDPLF